MKNYISVNAKYYKSIQIHKIKKHNIDRSDIDYLLNDEDITYKNTNIIYNDFQKLQDKKLQILKKQYDYKHNKNENTLVDMVVAISEEQAKFYLENDIDLMDGFNEFAKLVKEKYGFEPLSNNLHLDEGHKKDGVVKLNIHSHITFYNFDFEKNKTILRGMKKQDWSNIQDLAQQAFNTHQMDFKRGVSKDTTNVKHLERNDFIIKQQDEELSNIIKNLEDNKKELKEVYTNLNAQKNEYKNVKRDYAKTSSIYKILSFNIKNLQEQEKKKRQEHKQLNAKIKDVKEKINTIEIDVEDSNKFRRELKEDIKNYLNEHITKIDNKFTINNMNKFYNSLISEFESISNIDVKIEELERLRNSNNLLKSTLQQEKDKNDIYVQKLEKVEILDTKIKELIAIKDKLDDENYHLKSYIKDKNLVEDYGDYLIKRTTQKELSNSDMSV